MPVVPVRAQCVAGDVQRIVVNVLNGVASTLESVDSVTLDYLLAGCRYRVPVGLGGSEEVALLEL